jgi:hypothetical protein
LTGNVTGNLTGNADTATKLAGTTGSAPSYACRAWVNFDGTRDTTGAVSTANTNRLIRASGNVTSVLRNAAGDFTITFTTPMSDNLYSISVSSSSATNMQAAGYYPTGGSFNGVPALKSTTQIRVATSSNGGYVDIVDISVQIFGN